MLNQKKLFVGIHKDVYDYISSLGDLADKKVLDIPCGDGRASSVFEEQNATVFPLDIFPQENKYSKIDAKFGDMNEILPIESNSMDIVICQEGIEHISDQTKLLEEFNRVLKIGGTLIITTPSLSNMRSKFSIFFTESDLAKRSPPSIIDSVWHVSDRDERIYYGHLFLLTVNKLHTILGLAGFNIVYRKLTRLSKSSLVITILFYPLIILTNLVAYYSYRSKNTHIEYSERKKVLWEKFKLNVSLTTLLSKHTFWVSKKTRDKQDILKTLRKYSDKMSKDIKQDRGVE